MQVKIQSSLAVVSDVISVKLHVLIAVKQHKANSSMEEMTSSSTTLSLNILLWIQAGGVFSRNVKNCVDDNMITVMAYQLTAQ